MRPVLIIDDDDGIVQVLKTLLSSESIEVISAYSGTEGFNLLKQRSVDVVLLDVWLPGLGGLEVLKNIKKEYPEIPVVMISGQGKINIAVKAIKEGAFDFIEKPLSIDKTLAVIRNAVSFQALQRENKQLRTSLKLEETMIGECSAMRKVQELIQQSAPSNARVLILGENGTGKELVARQIHRQSPRNQGNFIEVNCAAIPENLIESELFGHEKGAFTNAVARRKGKFELADQGTLFLDEVADMSLSAQAKVLRAIQEMRFERIGAEESLTVDVRIICATNKDILQEVAKGRFREDLFYRLNVVPIHVPPLRERIEDIPLLINYFFQKFQSGKANQRKLPQFSPEALKLLQDYSWPGNIRELKNYLERVFVMVDEDIINFEVAREFLGAGLAEEVESPLSPWQGMNLNDAKDAFERDFIKEKLKENLYNVSKTAQVLGLYPSNLHSKLKKLGIEVEK